MFGASDVVWWHSSLCLNHRPSVCLPTSFPPYLPTWGSRGAAVLTHIRMRAGDNSQQQNPPATWETTRAGNRIMRRVRIRRIYCPTQVSAVFPRRIAGTAIPVNSTPVGRPSRVRALAITTITMIATNGEEQCLHFFYPPTQD